MKTATPISIKITLVIFCLFSHANNYSQDKKPTNKTSFTKLVKGVNKNTGIIRCATVEYEKYLQEKNPKRMTNAQFESWLAPLVKKNKAMRSSSQSGGIITIPVVVHVIHSGQAIGVAPNITDAQVQSQITVLNQDFRKMAGTPGDNSNPIGADTQIEFALAQQDPNGNPTNGIDRVSFCQESWVVRGGDIDMNVKPTTIWDPTQYLNIWSLNLVDDILGYAQLPEASGLGGLGSGGDPNTDGVVARYSAFGSSDYGTFLLNAPYDKGRTISHEVGHWLGLRHIWGDGNGDENNNLPDCTATDYCDDTPQAGWEHYVCGTFDTCPSVLGNDMPENYMDYTNDACMNIFTQDQKTRMTTIMNNAARRSSLKGSTKNLPVSLFANDAEVKAETNCSDVACFAGQRITIYNRGTSNLKSATLNYNINGATNTSYNWTGNLTTNQSDTFIVPINSLISGTLNISVVSANGGADQRNTNNTASGTYILAVTSANFTFTNFVFRLQRDLWGSETVWSLKNDSGITLYSGGPYTDAKTLPLPALITKTWTLANNQCYTFTINDASGDGLICSSCPDTSEDGYYDIKSTDGLTVVKSGGALNSYEITRFTTNMPLATNKFETSNDIYLYPNPTKGTLNVRVPNNFGLPNSLTISNSLGQIISRKEVSKENDLTVNTSALSNGVYFITVVKEDQKKTLQFIKE